MSRFQRAWLLTVAWATLGLVACEAPKQEPEVQACELLRTELDACDAAAQECEGELAECNAGCVVGLGCQDLVDPAKEPGALACLAHCAPKFTCDDGSKIPAAWKCDRKIDCADEEDEAQCD